MKRAFLILLTLSMLTAPAIAEQTFSYPKDTPIFSITFPDDWDVEVGEDISASSADELANIQLFALEGGDLKTAVTAAKEAMSESFEGMNWKGKPEKGELNDMPVTFLTGSVTIEGVEMALNCAVFAPKNEDTYFMLFNLMPTVAEEKHGDDLLKILTSVKG
ncbi:MAG: hypothetical protein ACK5TH_06475 [Prosthecobacter sp.]|jgi:hypothetical protein